LAWSLPTLIFARVLQGIAAARWFPSRSPSCWKVFRAETRRGDGHLRSGRGGRPISARRSALDHGQLFVALDFLHQPAGGLLAVFMAQWLVEDPPYIQRNKSATIDYVGFGLLAVWLGRCKFFWTRPGGRLVRRDMGAVVHAGLGFVVCGICLWQIKTEHPLVDLRVFKNRNFTIGLILMTTLGAILYGTTAQIPLFLQTLMGYPALQSGYAMSPRGIAAFVTTFFVGRLVGKMRAKWMMLIGFTLLAVSSFMLSDLNLQVAQINVIWPSVVNGIAISFIFVPLTTATMSQLAQQQLGNATGLYNLMRNLGGSIGIAFVTTMLARGAQTHQALMVGHLGRTIRPSGSSSPPQTTCWRTMPIP